MAKRKRPAGGGRPPGMAGGMPNQGALMRQLQQVQDDIDTAQAALADENIEVSVGGGALSIVISGHQVIQSISIDRDALDTEDEEWVTDLQDLLVAAMNQAIEQSKTYAEEKMKGVTGGLESMLPGGLGGLFG